MFLNESKSTQIYVVNVQRQSTSVISQQKEIVTWASYLADHILRQTGSFTIVG